MSNQELSERIRNIEEAAGLGPAVRPISYSGPVPVPSPYPGLRAIFRGAFQMFESAAIFASERSYAHWGGAVVDPDDATAILLRGDLVFESWREEELNSPISPGFLIDTTKGYGEEIEFTDSLAVKNSSHLASEGRGPGNYYFINRSLGYLDKWRANKDSLGEPRSATMVRSSFFGSARRAGPNDQSIQRFERGWITFDPEYGTHIVDGQFGVAYERHGGSAFLGAAKGAPLEVSVEVDETNVYKAQVQYFDSGAAGPASDR